MKQLSEDSCKVLLRDGRRLGFAEYGAANGQPVFFFHGLYSSRLHAAPYHDVAQEMNVRLISIDRPGYGLSDFQPNRQLLNWPSDVHAIAMKLGIRRFAVLGHSAGGAHAAACAAVCSKSVIKAALVSTPAPPIMPNRMRNIPWQIRLTLHIFHRFPWLSRQIMHLQSLSLRRFPETTLAKMVSTFPEPDAWLVKNNSSYCRHFVNATLESFRTGIGGSAHDARLHQRHWGFQLREITVPMQLWYGQEDFIVPPSMGSFLASQTKFCSLQVDPAHGHLSTLHENIRGILADLVY